MSFRRENEIDLDQLAAFLQNAVEKVKTEENPDLLNDIKKVYKKNVPFTLRMYVAAYLTKLSGSHYRPRREFNNDRSRKNDYRKENTRNDFRQEKRETAAENTETRTPRPRVQIDEALATTIFVGIGRNRRVYPRDLVGLLISVAGLERDRIGDIRVLANYSFVQLFTEDADKAINALNGYDYRGRKLSVSYSRQKDEEASPEETIPSSVDSGYSNPEYEQVKDDAEAYAAAEKAANTEGFSSPASSSESSSYLV
ncbi:DbpA RNA binding domain-containing protein [Treponema sp.]|uniref:DbpA RNA binding domain-containing protein n=1 Tax=Treponema sp. TaxID=166 RepID=UPI00298D99F5|nr:DbpA RNA binding domain-containing protein [Treponema sp.]MCR5613250.1 DbpA RNA binding domain-containing protein [Treponema sp.]